MLLFNANFLPLCCGSFCLSFWLFFFFFLIFFFFFLFFFPLLKTLLPFPLPSLFFFFFNFLFLLSLSASLSEYPSSISSPFPDLIQVQTLNEQEWERMQQANVLANVAQAFESDMDASDLEEDRETIFSSVDLLSPGGQADAQTLALMLQEQLDAINNEIRYQQLHGAPKPYLFKATTVDYFYCPVIYFNVFSNDQLVVWSVKCKTMLKNVDKCSDEILKSVVLSTTWRYLVYFHRKNTKSCNQRI